MSKLRGEIPTVIVEIRGGVAELTRKPKGVRVSIIDHDEIKEGGKGIHNWDLRTEIFTR